MNINFNEITENDIFSEESHYIVKKINKDNIEFKHLESSKIVTLSKDYITEMLITSDQYDKEVKVTKEDKKDGTPGIRTIFENISSAKVFTVVFKKQDSPKTKKAYQAELQAQRELAIETIEKAKKNKKSMAEAYEEALLQIQNNPVKEYIEGENRVLRGYKIQFSSRDGKYRCIDMDITPTQNTTNERLVNINTISILVVDGIKYIVE